MAESGVREIQLSGKQLAFLFMASVVALVVVFLLGVSVGRGAKTATVPPPPADLSATTEAPISAPPGTSATSDSLSFPKTLQGSAAAASKPADASAPPAAATAPPPSSAPPPAPVSTPAAETKTPASPPKTPPAPPAPQASQTSKPAAPAASPTTTTKPAVPPTGSWFVQVESFKSKALADALVAKLKGMGFDAGISDAPKPLLHVRVGPYAQRTAAEAAVAQLKKDGYSSPFVSR